MFIKTEIVEKIIKPKVDVVKQIDDKIEKLRKQKKKVINLKIDTESLNAINKDPWYGDNGTEKHYKGAIITEVEGDETIIEVTG